MIDYDPYAEDVLADPHPFYRRLREEAPAYYVEKYDAWADASERANGRRTLPLEQG